MTGVEAVSNGVSAFKKPSVGRAQQTLAAIIAILALLLGCIAYLCNASWRLDKLANSPYSTNTSQIE